MRNTQVAVYGRLKPCPQDLLCQEFDLKFGETEDQIILPSLDKNSPKRNCFRFKKIFDENFTQEQIFDTVAKPIINELTAFSVLSGYNGMIFTCGQTGSGKTYTMTGNIGEFKNRGLIPRTIQEIFRTAENPVIKITYCEIYNERVYDLIGNVDPEADGTRVNQLKNFKITMFRDLTVHKVNTAFEALQLLTKGNEKKMMQETGDGSFTSGSHVIFSIRLELPCTEDGLLHLNPILYLVDLASEENHEGSIGNPLETRHINLSLLYLEHVLLALSRPRKVRLPYRNSRLTAFLKATLGGNSITAVIATLSLSANDTEQTVQTCQFAERLGQIKSIAYPNEIIIPSRKIFNPSKDMELLEKQYKSLKAQLGLVLNNQLPEEDLDEDEKRKCAILVEKFLAGSDIIELPDCDIRKTIHCFHVMREMILKKEALMGTPIDMTFSDSSFKSSNELLLEASEEVSEYVIRKKNLERKGFPTIVKDPTNLNAPKEWELAEGNKINSSENTRIDEIYDSELKLAEGIHKNSHGSFQKPTEEFVLVQKNIADRPELVLCIIKSKEKEILQSLPESACLSEK